MRTYIYIDGFNFYYGAVKGTAFKWLDFKEFFTYILKSHHQILSIKYFTAMVSATPQDPGKPIRQETYIRAIESYIPEMEVYYGHFLSHEISAPLANPSGGKRFENVIKTEEKGSDVNLAVHLLNDAWLDRYDCAVIVSNDSDLAEAMRLIKEHHSQKVLGLITPGERKTSKQLQNHADFVRKVRRGTLAKTQLPNPIPGTTIRKPSEW
ncbi:MAG: NYN domain-containing protein [Syntrophobacteraceae bacterium]